MTNIMQENFTLDKRGIDKKERQEKEVGKVLFSWLYGIEMTKHSVQQ